MSEVLFRSRNSSLGGSITVHKKRSMLHVKGGGLMSKSQTLLENWSFRHKTRGIFDSGWGLVSKTRNLLMKLEVHSQNIRCPNSFLRKVVPSRKKMFVPKTSAVLLDRPQVLFCKNRTPPSRNLGPDLTLLHTAQSSSHKSCAAVHEKEKGGERHIYRNIALSSPFPSAGAEISCCAPRRHLYAIVQGCLRECSIGFVLEG